MAPIKLAHPVRCDTFSYRCEDVLLVGKISNLWGLAGISTKRMGKGKLPRTREVVWFVSVMEICTRGMIE